VRRGHRRPRYSRNFTRCRRAVPENGMSQIFVIHGDHIQLDQLLKTLALVESGGAAHAAVEAGRVLVDGKVETRKRAKLRPGQRVSFAGETVELVAENAA